MKNTQLKNELIHQAIFRVRENILRIERCINELSEEEIWDRPNDSSNSAGNLMLHICGNITQYIISSLGGREDKREREKEFTTTGGPGKEELFKRLNATVELEVAIIKELNEEELLRVRSVQGFNYSGMGIIIHVVEHLSYHTGQIAFWTKLLKDKDLDFYTGINLNKKNKPH